MKQLVFEVTDAWNLRCTYCAYGKLKKQCMSCKRIRTCVQCMFNLENLEAKPKCYGYMDAKAFQRYTNFQMSFLRKHPKAYKEIMENIVLS